jgi:hypothetical protein
MSTAQRLGVGLFYVAVAVSGAAYALFEHQQTDRLGVFIKETTPALFILYPCVRRLSLASNGRFNL